MPIAEWIRDQLWSRRDWGASLVSAAGDLLAGGEAPKLAERAYDLAQACELVVADVATSVQMYLLAWKAGKQRPEALQRARELCRELDDAATVAKIAGVQYRYRGDLRLRLVEAGAWLDADQPDRALKVLLAAAQAAPGDAEVAATLALARGEWPNARAEARRLAEAGELLAAARVLRTIGDDSDELGDTLRRAVEANPCDEEAFALFQRWTCARGDYKALLAAYRRRGEEATSHREVVDVYRRAGTTLIVRAGQRGMGLRLVAAAVTRAYDTGMVDIPGHLAMLALVVEELSAAKAHDRVFAYLDAGLALPLDASERLWMALTATDLAWNTLGDMGAASRYADIVREIHPGNALLADIDESGRFALGSLAAQAKDGWGDDSTGVDLLSRLGGGAMPAPPAPAPAPEPAATPPPAGGGMGAAALSFAQTDAPGELDLDSGRMVAAGVSDPSDAGAPAAPAAPEPRGIDRRQAARSPVIADVKVSLRARVEIGAAEGRMQAVTRDVSSSGLFLVTGQELQLGSDVALVVHLPGDDVFSVVSYQLTGRVVRKEAGVGYGLVLVDPPPEYQAATELLARTKKT